MIRPMAGREAGRPGRVRQAAFALVTLLLFLALVEGGARLVERYGGPVPAEVGSPCDFQQVPREPVMERLDPYDRELLTIDPSWVDNDGQVVAVPKADDELRVVFLGGSALGGWGLPQTAIVTGVVERLLERAAPDRRVQVINLGRTGWASPQLAWVFGRTAERLAPDLVVTLMGNNERMDVANALALHDGSPASLFASRWVDRRSALVRLLRPEVRRVPPVPSPPMPDLWELEDPAAIDRYVLGRLDRSLRRIRRATDAELLVSSVPVNHRYHPLGREWWFAGEQTFDDPSWRTAHWAWYHRAPARGAAAMRRRLAGHPEDVAAEVVLGAFLGRIGDPEAEAVLLRAEERLGSPEEPSPNGRMLLAWATRELQGAEAAAERVAPWVEQLAEAPADQSCDAADLVYYAGAPDPALYQGCLLQRMYYRADGVINDGLRRSARRADARFFDLDAELRATSPGGIPGWETFYDYCHYNPRGSLLVGHLLAGRIAGLLDLPGEVPEWRAAVEAWDRDRAGRRTDLPELDRWAGVSYDVELLTTLPLGGDREPRPGPPGTALTLTFEGNRLAAGASFGMMDAVPEALRAWVEALEVDPDFAPARRNLQQLLETDAGAWEAAHGTGGEAWRERLERR